MLLLGLVALLRVPFSRRLKIALVIGVLLVGLAGFFWKYCGVLPEGGNQRRAPGSITGGRRLQTAKDKPVFGTGPGTFAIAYQKIKRPESEMARLVHNDYLEQASDSGVAGFAGLRPVHCRSIGVELSEGTERLQPPAAGRLAGVRGLAWGAGVESAESG